MNAQPTFYRERIYPLLFMFIVTFLCILLTAGIYLLTQDRANTNKLSFTHKTILHGSRRHPRTCRRDRCRSSSRSTTFRLDN